MGCGYGLFLAAETEKGGIGLPPFVTIPCCVSLELPVDCFAASLCSVEHRQQDVDDYDVGQGSAQREGHA
jgi:hypothetical protein